jgi:hypothetical protein
LGIIGALKVVGFGVLMQTDVKDMLKEKINADFRCYLIPAA